MKEVTIRQLQAYLQEHYQSPRGRGDADRAWKQGTGGVGAGGVSATDRAGNGMSASDGNLAGRWREGGREGVCPAGGVE